jgi:multiple sugar transport system ATP-binding protein
VASVAFRHVTKSFPNGDVAVRDLTLAVRDGEFMVIVGPSGCGKTTALRLLAGLEDVTEGEMTIGDQVVNAVPSRNREVSMVFQEYALYPHMTVYDNIAFGLRMHGFPLEEVHSRVMTAAKGLGLTAVLMRKPREISGGEQQRVALARAIVKDPQVFLLDEPLSSVDAKLRGEMRVDLKRVQRGLRATFLYVTHDQVEAMTMGDRIAVMRDGELQQVGSPLEVYDHPANVFVAGFIGSPAMNFIPVTVQGTKVSCSAFDVDLPAAAPVERAVLGVRPEALSERVAPGVPTVDVEVELAEVLGRDQFVYGTAGGHAIIARIDPRLNVSPGERIRLAIDVREVHLFDAQTGRALV